MIAVDETVHFSDLQSRYRHERELDLAAWWKSNKPAKFFEWKLSNTRVLDFGNRFYIEHPSRIEVDEIRCRAFSYEESRYIRNVGCETFHVTTEQMKKPCLLNRLVCETVYVHITEFMDYDDALKMTKDWLNAIPMFSAESVGFSMPAKMLMDNDSDWFWRTGCNLCEVSEAAEEDEDYDFEPIPL